MNRIIRSQFVADDLNNGERFYLAISKTINEMQIGGMEVEIQFQATVAGYSALILGRKKNESW